MTLTNVKIQIKQTLDTARALASSGVPPEVIDVILGKTFEIFGNSYRVPARFNDQTALWDVPPHCCVVLSDAPRKGEAMQRAFNDRRKLLAARRKAKNKTKTTIYYPKDTDENNN